MTDHKAAHPQATVVPGNSKETPAETAALTALAEIREVWAGSEVGEPKYAQEAYAIRLCKQMYRIACEALQTAAAQEGQCLEVKPGCYRSQPEPAPAAARKERRNEQRRKVVTSYLCRGLPIKGIVDMRSICVDRRATKPAAAPQEAPTPRVDALLRQKDHYLRSLQCFVDLAKVLEHELAQANAQIEEERRRHERITRSADEAALKLFEETEALREKYLLLTAQHARLCEQVYEEDGETLKIEALRADAERLDAERMRFAAALGDILNYPLDSDVINAAAQMKFIVVRAFTKPIDAAIDAARKENG